MTLKVCVACSTGGHMVQARKLAPVYERYPHFYFTFEGGVAEEMKKDCAVRTIPNIVKHNPLTWFWGALLSARIVWQERPNIVISTGAGVVVFLCIFAKLYGAKLIFMESMARVKKPTITARLLYPFSDLFVIQWPGLKTYFPKAVFLGKVL